MSLTRQLERFRGQWGSWEKAWRAYQCDRQGHIWFSGLVSTFCTRCGARGPEGEQDG